MPTTIEKGIYLNMAKVKQNHIKNSKYLGTYTFTSGPLELSSEIL